MAVSAIQENNKNNSRKMGIIASTAVGGVAGYCLKYALPLNKPEKTDPSYINDLKEIKTNARIAQFEAIKKSQAEIEGADIFVKMIDEKRINVSEIKKLDEPVAKQVMKLITMVNDEARAALPQGKFKLKAYTKDLRPTGTFIAIGAGASLFIALVNNIFTKNDNKCNPCQEEKQD